LTSRSLDSKVPAIASLINFIVIPGCSLLMRRAHAGREFSLEKL
jgi:hypothetical protein